MHSRELAELAQLLIDTSTVLSTRAGQLLERLIADLPPDEEPTPLTASVHGVIDSSMTAELVWDNSGTGNHVSIDWGVTDAVDDDEPAVGTKTYQYALEGDYVIVVTDLEDATRLIEVDVTVPFVTGV